MRRLPSLVQNRKICSRSKWRLVIIYILPRVTSFVLNNICFYRTARTKLYVIRALRQGWIYSVWKRWIGVFFFFFRNHSIINLYLTTQQLFRGRSQCVQFHPTNNNCGWANFMNPLDTSLLSTLINTGSGWVRNKWRKCKRNTRTFIRERKKWNWTRAEETSDKETGRSERRFL